MIFVFNICFKLIKRVKFYWISSLWKQAGNLFLIESLFHSHVLLISYLSRQQHLTVNYLGTVYVLYRSHFSQMYQIWNMCKYICDIVHLWYIGHLYITQGMLLLSLSTTAKFTGGFTVLHQMPLFPPGMN